MPHTSEFVNHLLDLLAPLGGVTARGMFGGWGIYRDGLMFALVAYDTFYVKVDDPSRPEFTALGLLPFTYETKTGTNTIMSYHTVPTDALDSPDILCQWARKGIAAATRAAAAKKPRKPTKPRPRK